MNLLGSIEVQCGLLFQLCVYICSTEQAKKEEEKRKKELREKLTIKDVPEVRERGRKKERERGLIIIRA